MTSFTSDLLTACLIRYFLVLRKLKLSACVARQRREPYPPNGLHS